MTKQRTQTGFTLIELIVVMGIIAILAAIVIVAVNPARQLAQARNSTRVNDVANIQKAINQYRAANNGVLPAGLTTSPQGICKGPSGCATGTVDLSTLVPTYLTDLPKDPSNGTNADTGYTVYVSSEGRISVAASNAELSKSASTDGDTFNPMQIPSLSLWLDATSLTGLTNAAPIGAANPWADISGGGNNGLQPTTTYQPTYRTNVVNGKPVVRFDGVDDWLNVAGDSAFTERTYVFVVKSSYSSARNPLFSHGTYASGSFQFNYTVNRPILYLAPSVNYRYFSPITAHADGQAHLYEVYIKGPAQTDIASSELYVDGVLDGVITTVNTGAAGAWSNLTLGRADAGAGWAYNGDVAEFMAIKRRLTDQQRVNLLEYSRTKWGTP